MGWMVQRKKRKKAGKVGWYYTAVARYGRGKRITRALGFIEGGPDTKDVVAKLITEGPEVDPTWAEMMGLFPVPPIPEADTEADSPSEASGDEDGDYGAYTLQRFFTDVWWPVRSSEVAASTVEVEHKIWDSINDVLGRVRVRDLDAVRWQRFLLSKESWGATRRRLAQNAYRQALKHAESIGAVDAVHSFRPIRSGQGGTRVREPRALSMDEVGKLLKACKDKTHRALYAVMAGIGLRPGEACGLTWASWDMDQSILYPAGTKNRQASKAVPVAEWVMDEIKALWEEAGFPTEGPCFIHRGKPITKPYHGLMDHAKRAGLGKLSPYDLRHTFATELARQGVGRAAARRLMRHSSVSSVLERAYEHLDVGDVATVVEGLKGPKG